MNKTIYVPESCCFKDTDESMAEYPDDAVSLLVSRVAYDQAIAVLKKIAKNHVARGDNIVVQTKYDGRFEKWYEALAKQTLVNLGELDE